MFYMVICGRNGILVKADAMNKATARHIAKQHHPILGRILPVKFNCLS